MKLKTLFFALFVTFTLSAQPSPEKKAKKFADEVTQVLELNEEESKAVYEIQLDRIKQNQAIEKEYADNPEEKKAKIKELGNSTFNKMKALLGAERQKKWKAYKDGNK